MLVVLLILATATPIITLNSAQKQNTPTEDVATTLQHSIDAFPTEMILMHDPVEIQKNYSHISEIPLDFDFQEVMQKACEMYGVPYALALAVAESESSFDLEADSGTCWGLMQIHPVNYDRLRENGIEPTEYEGNITAGVFLLGELLEKYTDTHKALMAYNCGETGAKRLWTEGYMTSKYSVKVVTLSEKWQKIINDNDNKEATIND